MKKLIVLFIALPLFANIIDNTKHFLAQKEYKSGNYKRALKEFQKLPKNSEIYFEIANTLYRLKKYHQALAYYKLITNPKLEGAKLYNIANCYMRLNKLNRAIIFYKEASKFIKSKELKHNLLLAKNRLKNSQNTLKCKTAGSSRGFLETKIDNFDDPFLSKDLKLAKLKNEDKDNILNKSSNIRDSKISRFKEQNSSKNSNKKSNLENLNEQRILKKLNNKEIKTLLIPIGDKNWKYY